MNRWLKVEGVNHAELLHLIEKTGEQPEKQNELEKTAEFSIPTWMGSCDSMVIRRSFCMVLQVLNGLDHLGYKVKL